MARDDVEDEARELDETDPKLEQAVLGRDVQNWIETDPIGRYVVARAHEELQDAMEKLVDCPIQDLQALQIKARVARSIAGWLGAAIRDGIQAEELLQQQRDGAA